MSHILEIDSVQKYYDERSILTDVYLQCCTGEIIGLLGRNGSGKSTLMQIIFGTLDAQKFIRIDGKFYESPYKTKDLIAYLPQHDFIPKHLSVTSAAQLYLGKTNAEQFLDDALLKPLSNHKVGSLSGGEMRYLEVKLLLNTPCKFVLLDEPFSGVSPVVVEQIQKLILEKSPEKGIILSDHDYRNVLKITSRCCLIYQGSMKAISGQEDLVRWGYILHTS
jgi:ABC-type lipopolysaccharide export system ATPase subunit